MLTEKFDTSGGGVTIPETKTPSFPKSDVAFVVTVIFPRGGRDNVEFTVVVVVLSELVVVLTIFSVKVVEFV